MDSLAKADRDATIDQLEADNRLLREHVDQTDAWFEAGNRKRHGNGPWWTQCNNLDSGDLCDSRAALDAAGVMER